MKNHYSISFKHAFTMLELVFVIVALGIIASVAMPRFDRDLKQEAADTVLSNIRYTQHMALSDFKQENNNTNWQMSFWKINFEKCSDNGLFIGIGSDKDHEGDTDKDEAAIDPANGLPMFWLNTSSCEDGGDNTVSDTIFLTKKFGIKSVSGTGGCSGLKHIGFDHLGRPHVSFSATTSPAYSSYMSTACTFTFTMSDDETFAVTIEPETGYAFIVDQNAS